VDDEKYAQAAGVINYGFPTIADTDIPQILPTGVCTYEHVVSNIPHNRIVSKAIEVRGLKVQIHKVPVPVSYGPAFEGERVRKEDTFVEMGGNKTPAFEFAIMRDMNQIEDGQISVVGPEIDDIEEGSRLPLGIVVEVAGREFQTDFESIVERQINEILAGLESVRKPSKRVLNSTILEILFMLKCMPTIQPF